MRIKTIIIALALTMILGMLGAGCGKNNKSSGSGSAGEEFFSAVGDDLSAPEEKQVITKRIINNAPAEIIAKRLETENYPAYSTEGIRAVSVVVDGKVRYKINYTPQKVSDSYLCWNMVEPYGFSALIDDEKMIETIDGLQNFGIRGGTTNAAFADLTGETYITFNYVSDEAPDKETKIEPDYTLTVWIGEKTSKGYRCALSTTPDKFFYVKAQYVEGFIQPTGFDMVQKAPYIVKSSMLEKVEIKFGKKSKTLYHDEGNGSYRFGMKQVDEIKFYDMIQTLMSPTIYGVVDKKDIDENEKRKLVLSIDYIKSRNRGTVAVDIFRNEEGDYSIKVNGEEDFYLNSEEVEELFHELKHSLF